MPGDTWRYVACQEARCHRLRYCICWATASSRGTAPDQPFFSRGTNRLLLLVEQLCRTVSFVVGEQFLGVSSCFVQCFVHNKHPRDRPPQQIQQDQKRLQRHKHTKGGSRLPGLTRRGGKESTPSKDQRPKDTHTHTHKGRGLCSLLRICM